MSRPFTRTAAVFVASLAVSLAAASAAWGLPWDVDMADSAAFKGYERQMGGLPAGAIAQPSITSPRGYHANFVRGSADGEALQSPLGETPNTLALGKKMYGIYCTPCHGVDGVTLGPIAAPNRLPGVVPLGGAAGVAKNRSDAWIYLTVRNGGAIMPSYGHAMAEDEMWATVAYVRTLDNAKYIAPEVP